VDWLTGFAEAAVERLSVRAGVDTAALLGERVAINGCAGSGRTSCNGTCRLVPAADGWVAASLPRPEDVELLPAWLGAASLEEGIAGMPAAEAVERGRLLGLPVAQPGERRPGHLYETTRLGDAAPLTRPPLVVDLSSLWAGPLCTRILAERGARVIKVESTARPDGARGVPAFFALLNAGKEFVTVAFTAAALLPLLQKADVVVEGSRPRALEQLGIDAAAVASEGPQVWVSITGHGRGSSQRDWVGFGDDAAVAGGLLGWRGAEPHFIGDAVADPLTGIAAAGAVIDLLASGGRWLVDCSLAGVAAHVAGPSA
jgi:hypothetical protein